MNPIVKTILVWILILVAAIGLYNFVERNHGPSFRSITLTEFLDRVERGEVTHVEIQGSRLTGHLRVADGPFVTTMPENYTALYDKLTQRAVRVTIRPASTVAWLSDIPTVIVVVGSFLWFAVTVMILLLLVDLSKLVKRELARIGHGGSSV